MTVALIVTYTLLCRNILQSTHNRKIYLFLTVNIIADIALLMIASGRSGGKAILYYAFVIIVYLFIALLHYMSIKRFARTEGGNSVVPMLLPIIILIIIKAIPEVGFNREVDKIATGMIGLSYILFRLSFLALEVRNSQVDSPKFVDYSAYALFAPIMLLGPISRYSVFKQSISAESAPKFSTEICIGRILVGLVKYFYLGNILNQLTYGAFIFDGYPHNLMDIIISCIVYYLYLYCNFSGVCDIAIGVSGLMGVKIEENFNSPFAARNIKEFWNRWHITLSTFMRDILFTPLSKKLTEKLGVHNINHAVAISTFVVFIAVGVWHGVGWNYLLFGVMHGVGVSSNFYYSIILKKKLSKEAMRKYNNSKYIKNTGVVITFIYVSLSLMLFANDVKDIETLYKVLQ